MKPIIIKRIYEEPSENDGYRILVDRLWPRGVTKLRADLEEWNKNIAPSTELRKWFDHKEERLEEFALKYKEENPIILTSDNILQTRAKGLGITTISLTDFLRQLR